MREREIVGREEERYEEKRKEKYEEKEKRWGIWGWGKILGGEKILGKEKRLYGWGGEEIWDKKRDIGGGEIAGRGEKRWWGEGEKRDGEGERKRDGGGGEKKRDGGGERKEMVVGKKRDGGGGKKRDGREMRNYVVESTKFTLTLRE